MLTHLTAAWEEERAATRAPRFLSPEWTQYTKVRAGAFTWSMLTWLATHWAFVKGASYGLLYFPSQEAQRELGSTRVQANVELHRDRNPFKTVNTDRWVRVGGGIYCQTALTMAGISSPCQQMHTLLASMKSLQAHSSSITHPCLGLLTL